MTSRTLVLALHHPAVHGWTLVKAYVEGLRDAPALLAELQGVTRGLVLHGHLHRRIQRSVATRAGSVLQVGATSASLHHEEPDRMAGFNVYDLTDAGSPRVEAHVYSPDSDAFHVESVPKLV